MSFTGSYCKEEKEHESEITTGYARTNDDQKICYKCCGRIDLAQLLKDKKGILYLCLCGNNIAYVQNWPGTLHFPVARLRVGKHNIARKRYDVWFSIANTNWHGVTYGDNTQICHCRQVKN